MTDARCGAKTRSGRPCRSHPVLGKRRCRMHGGAEGTGAPRGNRNAVKHGRRTALAIAERASLYKLMRESRAFLEELKKKDGR